MLDSNIRSAAERNDLSESEIQTMLKDVGANLLKEKPTEIIRIGIDEIALIKAREIIVPGW